MDYTTIRLIVKVQPTSLLCQWLAGVHMNDVNAALSVRVTNFLHSKKCLNSFSPNTTARSSRRSSVTYTVIMFPVSCNTRLAKQI
jgi:hypothetical protein